MSSKSSGSQAKPERVIGTYLYPLGLFGQRPPVPTSLIVSGDFSSLKPNYGWYSEVLCRITTDSHEVMVTRMSGLFVRPPDTFSDITKLPYGELPPDYEDKRRFQEDVARSFNLLICELAFHGVVSEPAAPAQIAGGEYQDGHAIITRGHGGRESYRDRQTSPWERLTKGDVSDWTMRSEVALGKATRLSRAKQLASISPSVPAFVAGAYSRFSQGQMSEALLDSWIVVEQLLDHLWNKYRSGLPDTDEPNTKKGDRRKEGLKDT
ncbi:MAG: hypothetical protein H0T45_08440, partial [Pyrinomonadaceae bacterium]|nr:hypothetical protein [Pyrinomonadaceae bacterium]